MIMTYNEQTNVQMTDQELSDLSGGIVPIFKNPEDEKEWRDGYQKYCTKPNKWNDNGGRYPEECFSYE